MEQKRKLLNERGSSLILVMIGAAFLGILGALILSITFTNLELKSTDNLSKKNFYVEEVAVNEITAMLEEFSATSMSNAYTWLVQNYSKESIDRATSYETFKKRYMIELSQLLYGTPGAGEELKEEYSVQVLQHAIRSNLMDEANSKNVVVKVYHEDPSDPLHGQIIHSKAEGNYTFEYMTLKNVSITYTENGYETTIVTDINLELPKSGGLDTTFAKYALISDQLVYCDARVSVTGGVYGGKRKEKDTAKGGDAVNPNTGGILVFGDGAELSIDGNGNPVAVRTNITAANNAKLFVTDANVWANNIMTFGVGSASNYTPSIRLDAVTKIADDLILKANNSSVTLNKEFYGFSYSGKNKDNETASEQSSAITVNAQNVSLDMSNLDILAVFGRAYISAKSSDPENITTTVMDIMTGQSVAVKYDQGAYLVPNENYLKIDSNPIDKETIHDYAEKLHSGDFGYDGDSPHLSLDMKEDIVDFTKGEAKAIYKYLNQDMPVRAIYYNQGTGSSVQMVNFYFNFKDEQSANAYFKRYYAKNKEELVDTYNKFYRNNASGSCLKFKSAPTRFQLAGDVLYQKADGSYEVREGNMTGIKEESEKLSNEYKSIQLNLRTGGDISKSVEDNEYVDTHFDLKQIKKDGNFVIDTGLTTSTRNKDAKIYISNDENFNVNENMSGLVIASGDVTVYAKEFEGLIIADGTIHLKSNESKILADEKLILAMLKDDSSIVKQLRQYINGMGTGNSAADDDTIKYGDAISFENWRRNV